MTLLLGATAGYQAGPGFAEEIRICVFGSSGTLDAICGVNEDAEEESD
jgi:hypothetical protein